MNDSLGIRGGRILDPGRGVDLVGDVLIREGRIATVGPGVAAEAARIIDATGLIVCPGLVDIHCHLREPGFEHKETIETGTRAAAAGGFTTVCCMPNTEPPIDSRASVEYILRTAAAQGVVRVLPIGCITRGRQGKELAEMGDLAEAGAVAFSDDGSPVADGALMRHALEYASVFALPVIEHCEEPSLSHEGVMHEGWVANRLGLRGIPAAAEEAAVARNIALAEFTGTHLHVAHVSTAGSVELVRAAKARGVQVTAEVTPHHLALTDEAVMLAAPVLSEVEGADGSVGLYYDTNAKVNPPLRPLADVQACIEGLADGTIDAIATDHAPHAIEDKLCEFDLAAFGISGLETALALCLTFSPEANPPLAGTQDVGVHGRDVGAHGRDVGAHGHAPLQVIIERLTAGPVRALGLARFVPGLGSLAEGAPGDVLVFDPEAEWVVEPERFASKGKNTPLAGRTLRGKVVATVYGGKVVWEP
ncbi:MAG: dihydroorotase [Dehalococcoidia bacterium]|nr:dihydroorotase [Dehalococcoidia bacterium]